MKIFRPSQCWTAWVPTAHGDWYMIEETSSVRYATAGTVLSRDTWHMKMLCCGNIHYKYEAEQLLDGMNMMVMNMEENS